MNTYTFELRMLKPWAWIISVAAILVLVMTMYPSVEKDVDEFTGVLANMPEAFLAAFKLELTVMSSALGFLCVGLPYIEMIAGVQAVLWGAAVITKERRFHTADFLLAKPRNRVQILTAKVLAVLTGLAATTVAFAVISASLLGVYGKGYSGKDFFFILLGFIGLQAVFFAVGLFTGVTFQKIKNPLGVSLGVVFGSYIAGVIGGLSDNKLLKLLSPFECFSAAGFLTGGSYSAGYVLFAVLLTAACVAGGYYVFVRQDVR